MIPPQSIDAADLPARMAADLLAYVEQHAPTGHFLGAVLANDLVGACRHGAATSCAHLPAIIDWLQQHAPAKSWGTAARVADWVSSYNDGIPF